MASKSLHMAYLQDNVLSSAIAILQIVFLWSLYSFYFTAVLIQAFRPSPTINRPRRGCHRWLELIFTVAIAILYMGECFLIAFSPHRPTAATSDPNLVYALFSTLFWVILSVGNSNSGKNWRQIQHQGAWMIALLFESTLLGLGCAHPLFHGGAKVAQATVRIARVFSLVILNSSTAVEYLLQQTESGSDEEVSPLLPKQPGDEAGDATTYGAVETENTIDISGNTIYGGDEARNLEDKEEVTEEDEDNKDNIRKIKENWWLYVKTFRVFLPYMWPAHNLHLQLCLLGTVLCVLTQRFLNVVVPLSFGLVINELSNPTALPWKAIAVFVVGSYISSSGIYLVKEYLWMSIETNATRQLKSVSYQQIMNLSCDFHDSKKSAITWQTLERGAGIVDLFKVVGLELLPIIADLVIAISIFWWLFDAYMGFIMALSAVLFWWSTWKTMEHKITLHRSYVKAFESEYTQLTESSQSWATVSYFGRIPHENSRYRARLLETQKTQMKSYIFYDIVYLLQSSALECGLLTGCILVASQIVFQGRKVGDFVILITYWEQFSSPLQYLTNSFTRIAKLLVDAEKLLNLLNKKPTVIDYPDAKDFMFKRGGIEFENVSFSYDGKRQVTKNLNFKILPGETVALVGETGGGKSTIFKLLFRFYDPTDGRILVDGQDIRKVKTESYRAHVGVVPQDPAMFNISILENLRYPNLDATDGQIREACKAVALHDKIMTFSKGYNELVGERGVKLSGGELQRVAIARAMLKNPHILLLDEATSSVDTQTEAQIQASLKTLSVRRTTFVIAHRLSTVIKANKILVIKDGAIVEAGSHRELIKGKGAYNKLWASQLKPFLGETRTRSKSRSQSPSKNTAVLFNDLSSGEEVKALMKDTRLDETAFEKQPTGEDESPGDDTGVGYKSAHDRGHSRGRSPTKNIVSSVRRRISRQNSARKSETSKSISNSPTRTDLKPDAPEFVPKTFQSTMLSSSNSSTRDTDSLVKKRAEAVSPVRSSFTRRQTPADADKENVIFSMDGLREPLSQSAIGLGSIPEEGGWKITTSTKTLNGYSSFQPTVRDPETREEIIPQKQIGDGERHSKDEERRAENARRSLSPRRKHSASEPIKQGNGLEGGNCMVDLTSSEKDYTNPLRRTASASAKAKPGALQTTPSSAPVDKVSRVTVSRSNMDLPPGGDESERNLFDEEIAVKVGQPEETVQRGEERDEAEENGNREGDEDEIGDESGIVFL